jgi:cell wall-associated NlpC family hydrolase
MKYRLPYVALFFSVWFLCGFALLEPSNANDLLKDVSQDFLSYASPKTLSKPLMVRDVQLKHCQSYLEHYFSPWKNPALMYQPQSLLALEKDTIHEFTDNPGWGENKQPHAVSWVKNIVQNMDINAYPNFSREAITTQVTHLRALPTSEPAFHSSQKAGEGYPFDRISVSLVPANLPLKVVQLSKDRAWAFVLTPYNAAGWIPYHTFAWVDKTFMQRWESGHYVAITQDKTPFYSEDNFLFFARLGSIYPLISEDAKQYRLLAATMDPQHRAVLQEVSLFKTQGVDLPMPLTVQNLGRLANLLMGQPYDWGGYYGYHDCSSTLMDLFAPFGIWLPRNSSDQVHTGEFISLSHLDLEAKKAYIEKHAAPFLTILWAPGHVALYLDKKNAQSYMYQTMWGLSTHHWFEGDGRLVVGKTVITPLNFGEDFYFTSSSFFARIQGMMLIPTAVTAVKP